jgi:transcriptional regulator with GAF, ATPase, and Fis domain
MGLAGGGLAGRGTAARAREAALAGVAALGRERRIATLLERLAEVALDVTSAERVFVVELGPEGPVVRARAGSARTEPGSRPSRVLVARALREGTVVRTDALLEHDASTSVHALALRSVVAVRLPSGIGTRPPFAVLADDRLRAEAFDAETVDALRTVADVAGPLLSALVEARRARRGEREAERHTRSLEAESLRQREALRSLGAGDAFASFVHASPRTARLVSDARRLAGASLSILLVGPSGVGKDLLARGIHHASDRRDHPFVAEAGAALSGTLLESTLFGHVRGAFTGADRSRKGLFELADGGTLFLDGLEDVPLDVQAKLLRVLVEGRVRPLGSDRARAVDVRVLCAVRRPPETLLAEGTLREDLYYRLAGATLVLPPLAERPEDLDAIAARVLGRTSPPARLSVSARHALHAHRWPGNVRELEHTLARAALAAAGELILPEHLDLPRAPAETPHDLHARRGALTRELVLAALARHGGNRTHAARALGISRFGLQKILRRLGDQPAK